MKKIAVVGSGIAGVSTAYYLTKLGYEVSLFEGGDHFGGHTHTHDINYMGYSFPVDTGFLVHNDRTYPNLIKFFKELDITVHYSDMSFSVLEPNDNIMWAGTNLLTVFGQYRNILSPRFYSFVAEILRFNKKSIQYLEISENDLELSLGDLLDRFNYSDYFRRWYLLPIGGCIWSTPTNQMLEFPAHTFLRFCINHGLLQVVDRPQWKTIDGGCRTYVDSALEEVSHKYLKEEVTTITPCEDKVLLKSSRREESYDACFLCCHPPQTLKIVKDISHDLHRVLSQFKFQKNKAILHCDPSVLPKKKFWSAWNYRSQLDQGDQKERSISVSYLINQLQPLPVKNPVVVTLNPVSKIDPNKIWKTISYEHPIFDRNSIAAQGELGNYQGQGKLYFSGAWLRYGFHEDGILRAKEVINQFLINEGGELPLLSILNE